MRIDDIITQYKRHDMSLSTAIRLLEAWHCLPEYEATRLLQQ